MQYHIVVTDSGFPNHHQEEQILLQIGKVIKASWQNEDELLSAVATADALLVQWAPITRKIIAGLENCRIIVRYGIGYDNIDLDAAAEKGIVVCNVPDYCVDEVADHTLALTLSALRQIPETDQSIRNGNWNIMLSRPVAPFSGQSFCLAGFGRIARGVAKRALGMGFKVKAYDPFVDPEFMKALKVDSLSSEELFLEADILSLHLPLQAATKHFVNAQQLGKMKPNALIVNTSRGGLIDSNALAKSLSEGQVWGAALDVFEEEPLPKTHALRVAPGVTLSSHVAWYSNQSIPVLQSKAAEEIYRFFSGESVKNRVR